MTSKDLANQIRTNTRVILPNFGAFLQKSTDSSTFDANGITFSPFLRYDDGVLETQIAKLKGISIDNAAKEISALIDEISCSIAQTKSYKIDDLGYLVQDTNKNIVFKTSLESTEQPLNNKPLIIEDEKVVVDDKENVDEKIIEKELLTPTITIEDEKTTISHPNNQSQQAEEPKNTEPQKTDVSKQKKSTPAKPAELNSKPTESEADDEVDLASIPTRKKVIVATLFVIVSIAVIIGIAYLIRNTVFPSQIDIDEPKSIVSIEEVQNLETTKDTSLNTSNDNIDKAFDALPEEKSEPQKPAEKQVETEIETSVVEAAQKINNEANFYLIVGSFKERANAEELFNELKQKNLNPVIVARSNGSFSLSIGSYATRSDANSAKQKYSQQFPAAWVMSKP